MCTKFKTKLKINLLLEFIFLNSWNFYCQKKTCKKPPGSSWFACLSPGKTHRSNSRALLVLSRTMVGLKLCELDHCYSKLQFSYYLCFFSLFELTRLVVSFEAFRVSFRSWSIIFNWSIFCVFNSAISSLVSFKFWARFRFLAFIIAIFSFWSLILFQFFW